MTERADRPDSSDQARTSGLAAVLSCPRCLRGGLSLRKAGWICETCSAGHPVIGGIPWLFADPQAMLSQWRGRFRLLLLEIEREVRTLRAELAREHMRPLTRQRLERLVAAHGDHAQRLASLLAPLDLGASQTAYETHLALRTRLPGDQGLTNYYVNLHRDWGWGDEENEASVALIQSALPGSEAWGRTLVLGAGGGRLAYDLHERFAPVLTVAIDFNPLLLFVASEVTQGREVQLYEFPIAPRSLADHAVLRTLAAPRSVREGFHFVAGDALRAPFVTESFDTVVTPWLIDVVDEELPVLAARVNRLLKPGGRWVNFGSLSFAQEERARRLSLEETLAIVADRGFSAPNVREASMPYMRSPASRHARVESVIAWCAHKERSADAPPEHSSLPEWLVRGDQPVPLLEDFRIQAASTRIHAFLMAMIDGKRSMRDMARMLVEQRLMTAQEAEPAIRTFLTRMYEDSMRRGGF